MIRRTGRLRPAGGLLVLWLAAPAAGGAERALGRLWEQQREDPLRHVRHVEACRDFVSAHPGSPLLPVAHTLAAWHLLRMRQEAPARHLLERYLEPSPDPVRRGAREMARTWLTRLDREQVRRALQAYYRQEIRFPESLRAIVEHPRIPAEHHPPLTDRWGRPWIYRPLSLSSLPGAPAQRYTLESAELGEASDLAAALERPYGQDPRLRPLGVVGSGEHIVARFQRLETGGETLALSPGVPLEGWMLVYAGAQVIVVGDRDHWHLFSRPAP